MASALGRYESLVRPVLFRIADAERSHHLTLAGLRVLSRLRPVLRLLRRHYRIDAPRTLFGVTFPNPVGLAAGLDKDGLAVPAWQALGFGFIEVGTVTARAQPGNPKPRMFRYPPSEAVINRVGFANRGAEALAARLARLRGINVPLGISLGKSRDTPLDAAVDDYLRSFELLCDHGDYFVVNVSSPNTAGLRSLQERHHLDALLAALGRTRPVLVKVAPDLDEAALASILQTCTDRGAAGIIATNTTVSRDGLDPRARVRDEPGGLSGRPLTARAREVVAFIRQHAGDHFPIIGVGGIMTADDALRMFDAGADLVQLCTGLIYRGPALVRAINLDLLAAAPVDQG